MQFTENSYKIVVVDGGWKNVSSSKISISHLQNRSPSPCSRHAHANWGRLLPIWMRRVTFGAIFEWAAITSTLSARIERQRETIRLKIKNCYLNVGKQHDRTTFREQNRLRSDADDHRSDQYEPIVKEPKEEKGGYISAAYMENLRFLKNNT